MSIEALKLALEALEDGQPDDPYPHSLASKAITALRQAIEQAEQAQPVAEAMKTVTKTMQDDPGYAWGWHCNIAMAFVDAGGDYYTANQGAARFMKLLANVEPAHELPSAPPPRQPLTDEQRCYCGNIYRLGVVHREHTFCDEQPQKPLTDEEICPWFQENTALTNEAAMRITRAIEAAHGITGEK